MVRFNEQALDTQRTDVLLATVSLVVAKQCWDLTTVPHPLSLYLLCPLP